MAKITLNTAMQRSTSADIITDSQNILYTQGCMNIQEGDILKEKKADVGGLFQDHDAFIHCALQRSLSGFKVIKG